MTETSMPWTKTDWTCCALLLGAPLLVFHFVMQCEFVNIDDPVFVTENPQLRLGLSRPGLWWGLNAFAEATSPEESGVVHWHPLVWYTFLLDYELYGLNAWGYHVTNLLWHVGSTLLLFLALRRLLRATWPSFLVAILFAVHPLNVQAVAWVAERKGLVSTFFWMLTLWAYAVYVERPSWQRYTVVAVSLALGLQAKQMLVTLPCVLLLLDYWPLRRGGAAEPAGAGPRAAPRSLVWLVAEKLPLVAVCVAFALLVLVRSTGAEYAALEYPLGQRVGNALIAYVAYLRQAVLPVDLALYYPQRLWPLEQVLWAAFILLALSAAALLQARRRPYLAVGWLWYVGTLFPVSGVLVQIGGAARADRYAYVPMVGIFLAVVCGLSAAAQRLNAVRPAALVATGVLFAFMILSWQQVHYWQSSVLLWEHDLATAGPNAEAFANLGTVLLPDPATARPALEAAVSLDPTHTLALHNLGLAHMALGEHEAGEKCFRLVLTLKPQPGRPRCLQFAHLNLGRLEAQRGNLDAAATHFEAALRLDPNFVAALEWLGHLRLQQGDTLRAAELFRTLLRLQPDHAGAGSGLEQARRVVTPG